MSVLLITGTHTIETVSKQLGIKKSSAINLLSRLKKEGKVTVSGGGKQKRIYHISQLPQEKTNGFYDLINKYSKLKLVPSFKHVVHGRYTIEQAIIDGIKIGDARTLEATMYLFKRVANWKRLFDLAKKNKVEKEIHELYSKARKTMKCRRMPKKYEL
ncbi:MAG: hypothetical protein ISS25_01855 [Nanoarchaeota archaeon]|nr:hypothetical protein [DPANN group archaeon]MBL7116550.1 hypothetical protein [Nanoarchaeota archaeon]